MTITGHAEPVRRFAEDFTALQEAVLARTNGICAAETAAVLEHASLAGPIAIAIALTHADVLARGDVRRAELSGRPAEQVRRLREHARKVRRARSRADAVCKEQRARRTAAWGRGARAVGRAAPSSFFSTGGRTRCGVEWRLASIHDAGSRAIAEQKCCFSPQRDEPARYGGHEAGGGA